MFTRAELAALYSLALAPGNALEMCQLPIHRPGQLSPVRHYFKERPSLPLSETGLWVWFFCVRDHFLCKKAQIIKLPNLFSRLPSAVTTGQGFVSVIVLEAIGQLSPFSSVTDSVDLTASS